MDIPGNLISQIKAGKCVAFWGAGLSQAAKLLAGSATTDDRMGGGTWQRYVRPGRSVEIYRQR